MLEHIGDYDGYQIYRNSDGFLEGYKKVGANKLKVHGGVINLGTDVKRIVTVSKTIKEFIDFIDGQKTKTKKNNFTTIT